MLVTVMMYFKVLPESVQVMKPLIESKPVIEQPILNSILKEPKVVVEEMN